MRVKAVLAANVALVAVGMAASLHLWLRTVDGGGGAGLPHPRLTLPGTTPHAITAHVQLAPRESGHRRELPQAGKHARRPTAPAAAPPIRSSQLGHEGVGPARTAAPPPTVPSPKRVVVTPAPPPPVAAPPKPKPTGEDEPKRRHPHVKPAKRAT